MKVRTRAPQGQFLLERILATEEGVTVEVRGFDLEALEILARRVAEGIEGVPGVTAAAPIVATRIGCPSPITSM